MAETPTPPPAAPGPECLEVQADDSPVMAAVPFWLTACVRLAPPVGRTGKPTEAADKVITAAQVLLADRLRVDGEDRVLHGREVLAQFLGYGRSDKARWVTDYLERVGFLTIKDQARDKHGRRRNRLDPQTGRSMPDVWRVREQPPLGYVGPRTFAELRVALAEQRLWSLEELFVSAQVNPSPSREGLDAPSSPSREGADEFSQVNPSPSREGLASPSREGLDAKPQVSSSPSREGLSEGKERERTLSEGSLSRSIGSSAPPPAGGGPGDDAPEEALTAQVRDLVRRLPWEDTGRGRTAAVLEEASEQLVPAIAAAIRRGWVDLGGAQQHALRKIREAARNPVSYLVIAFSAKNIPLPTPEDVLRAPSEDSEQGAVGAESAAPDRSAASGEPGNVGGSAARAVDGDVGECVAAQPASPERRAQHREAIFQALQDRQQNRQQDVIRAAARRDAEFVRGREHTA